MEGFADAALDEVAAGTLELAREVLAEALGERLRQVSTGVVELYAPLQRALHRAAGVPQELRQRTGRSQRRQPVWSHLFRTWRYARCFEMLAPRLGLYKWVVDHRAVALHWDSWRGRSPSCVS